MEICNEGLAKDELGRDVRMFNIVVVMDEGTSFGTCDKNAPLQSSRLQNKRIQFMNLLNLSPLHIVSRSYTCVMRVGPSGTWNMVGGFGDWADDLKPSQLSIKVTPNFLQKFLIDLDIIFKCVWFYV